MILTSFNIDVKMVLVSEDTREVIAIIDCMAGKKHLTSLVIKAISEHFDAESVSFPKTYEIDPHTYEFQFMATSMEYDGTQKCIRPYTLHRTAEYSLRKITYSHE